MLAGFDLIDVPQDEPYAANTLTVGDTILTPVGFPKTRGLIEERGFKTLVIDISELRKAEAGLTCLSLIFESQDGTPDDFSRSRSCRARRPETMKSGAPCTVSRSRNRGSLSW